jgi:lipopolysaccharide export system protein LptA
MRKSNITTTALSLCGLLLASSAFAQSKGGAPAPKNSSVSEAARILQKARESGDADEARRALEAAADNRRAERLAAQAPRNATTAPVDPAADKRLSTALQNLSSPEGKALLAQNNAAPALRAPDSSQVIPVAKVVPVDASAAKPEPLKATPLTSKAKKEPARTIITSQGAAFFDSKTSMGVFTDDVVVAHPQFHLTGDELEIYMLKDSEKPAAPLNNSGEPIRPAGVLPGEGPPSGGADSGIRQAIAKGRKVVIQKLSETGEVQVGICRHATYVGATGDIIMRDFPQVQRGMNVIRATAPSTIITILANGRLKVNGPSTTDIIQEADKKPARTSPEADPNGAPAPVLQTKPSADAQ